MIKRITPSFNFSEYFTTRRKNFNGWFDASECLSNSLYNSYLLEKPINLWMVFIEYKTNPYIYEYTITNQTVSNFQTLFFLDVYANKVQLNDCKQPIKLYYPIKIFDQVVLDYINANRDKFNNPQNLLPYNSPVYSHPFYINQDGFISKDLLAKRIEANHCFYNLTCRTFIPTNNTFSTKGVTYSKVTEDFFLVCDTYHLSDFSPLYEYNPPAYKTDSRFYFVYQWQIFKRMENYLNMCVYTNGAALGLFILILSILLCIESAQAIKEGLIEEIKYYIIRMAKPFYREEEIRADLEHLQNDPEYLINRDDVNINVTEQVSFKIEHVKQETMKSEENVNSSKEITDNDNSNVDDDIRGNHEEINNNPNKSVDKPADVGGKDKDVTKTNEENKEIVDKDSNSNPVNAKKKKFQTVEELEEINIADLEVKKENIKKKKVYLKGRKQMIKFLEDDEDDNDPDKELKEKDKPKKKEEEANIAQMSEFFHKHDELNLPKPFSPQKKVEINNFIEDDQKFKLDDVVEKNEKNEKTEKEEKEAKVDESKKADKSPNQDKPEDEDLDLLQEGEGMEPGKHFLKNIIYRNIYFSPFIQRDVFNPRWKKLILMFASTTLMLFFNACAYTSIDNIIIVSALILNYIQEKTLRKDEYLILVGYSTAVAIFSNSLVIIFVAYWFRVPQYTRERLYRVLLSGVQMKILKDWYK